MDFISDEQMKKLEGGGAPDVISDEEMAKMESGQAPTDGRIDTPSWVPDIIKQAAGAVAAKQAGLVQSASLGYGKLEDLPVLGDSFKQASEEHPAYRMYGSASGAVAPGAAMGAAAAPLAAARYLNNPVGRTAVNAGMGGIEGLIKKPEANETRLGNAAAGARNSAIVGGGMEALAGLSKGGGKLAQWLGQKLGGVSNPEATAYKQNPQDSERLADMMRNDPMGLSNEVKSHVKGGLDDAFENTSRPALERVEKAVLGKSARVNPADFQGTAAGQEIDRTMALRPRTKTWNVPVEEKYTVSATPVRAEANAQFGEPQTWVRPDRYTATEVPVASVERSIAKDGPEAVIQEGFLPRGTQTVTTNRPAPDAYSLEGKPMLTAKRLSQRKAFENQANALNPLAYNAANDADAIAAGRLKSAIENIAPSTAADNAILEESARYSAHARNTLKNNPAAILTNSEAAGSVPMRSMRQFLDKNGGTQLDDMSNRLSAGMRLGTPEKPEGFWDATKRYAAKGALTTSGKADSAEQILRDMKLRALLGSEVGSAGSEKEPKGSR